MESAGTRRFLKHTLKLERCVLPAMTLLGLDACVPPHGSAQLLIPSQAKNRLGQGAVSAGRNDPASTAVFQRRRLPVLA